MVRQSSEKTFYLATAADIVADPSAPDAFVEGIMRIKSGFGTMVLLKREKLKSIKSILLRQND